MKTTFKSEKGHWAVGYEITCRKCTSRFMAENECDFRDGFSSEEITIQCPECQQWQRISKPVARAPYYGPGTILCGTTATGTSANDDWMGNFESQQEYLGK